MHLELVSSSRCFQTDFHCSLRFWLLWTSLSNAWSVCAVWMVVVQVVVQMPPHSALSSSQTGFHCWEGCLILTLALLSKGGKHRCSDKWGRRQQLWLQLESRLVHGRCQRVCGSALRRQKKEMCMSQCCTCVCCWMMMTLQSVSTVPGWCRWRFRVRCRR